MPETVVKTPVSIGFIAERNKVKYLHITEIICPINKPLHQVLRLSACSTKKHSGAPFYHLKRFFKGSLPLYIEGLPML